ncbi:hypothetical protein E1263_04530 [Kribbella antibiotica]|uniref:PLL-like beta propeller domain-containing protein n=1 Tax=Kribbella antibiotica TaxID=190195 RepID=A0A4R4ZSU2_9ACTN|nr:hypothetical protein [Kribbella antibiotica]TDD62148.1 hypothetical protein E1263_04530 [Kribbella antibiotica]
MRLARMVLVALLLAGQFALPAHAAEPAGTWNPQAAPNAGVPVPPGNGSYYMYAPSVVQLTPTERMVYTCANRVSGQTWDHIGMNYGTRRADGTYAWGAVQFPLNPQAADTPFWASNHICDPEVVRGSFRYDDHTYAWAMFVLGYPDLGKYPNADPINVIGVAYADQPQGPWKLSRNALLDRSTDGPLSSWGVGQPSVTSIDGAGRVLVFYSGVGRVSRREIDLSDANNPKVGARVELPGDGLTPEPDGGVWLHNASFVYDPARDEFLMSRDTGASNPRVQTDTEINRIASSAIWSGTGTWSVVGRLNECQSGFKYNHNSGIVRNAYGMIADSSEIDVYFATEQPGGDYWAYRLSHAQAPLAFTSGAKPELVAQENGQLTVLGHTANRCEANVWSSTQAGPWTKFGASPAGRPVAARQPDGRVALFSRANDGSIWWNVQSAPNGGHPGWSQLAGSASAGDPVVGKTPDGRLVAVTRRNEAPGSRVYVNTQQAPNGAFASTWQDLGASPAGQPVIGTNQDGSLVLFARAAKEAGGQIWFNQQNGTSWTGWQVVESSPSFDGQPSVARQADGRLVLVARRWEGQLSVVYRSVQTATGFTPWTSLGASPANDAVLVEQAARRLAIFARAADGSIWWAQQQTDNGAFASWTSLAGNAGDDPVAQLRSDNRLDLVVRQPDGRIAHRIQTAPGATSFDDWQPIK